MFGVALAKPVMKCVARMETKHWINEPRKGIEAIVPSIVQAGEKPCQTN